MAVKEDVNIELRGIVYREGEWWFAHCLELDVVAEGRTPDEAVQSAVDLCEFQIRAAIESNDLEAILRPAPSKYWSLYFSSTKRRRTPPSRRGTPLMKFEARELVLA
jgi:predicted RNase H-like HicB family nuclease